MDLLTSVLLGLVVVCVVTFLLLRRRQHYWSRLGIPCAPNAHLIFGHVKGISQTRHMSDVLDTLYWQFKKRRLAFGGYMNFFAQPALLVLDPELAKHILAKDFNVFFDRGIYSNPTDDPLSGGLFSLYGNHWKMMRQKISPAFTSGKMKYMFDEVLKIANKLDVHLAKVHQRTDLELKDLFQRFTMDVIGSVAFGIDCGTLANPVTTFSHYGEKALVLDAVQFLKFFIGGHFRSFCQSIGMKVLPGDVSDFFYKLTKGSVDLREQNNEQRNDFINLLMEIRRKAKLSGDSYDDGMTMNEMAAQCLTFFTAGSETSSLTITYCIYELAKNSDIQERVRAEIEETLASNNNGQLSYDVLMSMSYLDRVVSETLRMHPPVDNLFRINSVDYTMPGTKHRIPAGTLFQIPVYSMQNDPEYYPEPTRFDPDRFQPERSATRHPFTYLPFGDGPRICIGMRFGLMQTKIGLVTLLRNYRFSPSERTPANLISHPSKFLITPKDGVYLKIEPISKGL